MKFHFSSSRGEKNNFSSRISRDRDSCQGLAQVSSSGDAVYALFCRKVLVCGGQGSSNWTHLINIQAWEHLNDGCFFSYLGPQGPLRVHMYLLSCPPVPLF